MWAIRNRERTASGSQCLRCSCRFGICPDPRISAVEKTHLADNLMQRTVKTAKRGRGRQFAEVQSGNHAGRPPRPHRCLLLLRQFALEPSCVFDRRARSEVLELEQLAKLDPPSAP